MEQSDWQCFRRFEKYPWQRFGAVPISCHPNGQPTKPWRGGLFWPKWLGNKTFSIKLSKDRQGMYIREKYIDFYFLVNKHRQVTKALSSISQWSKLIDWMLLLIGMHFFLPREVLLCLSTRLFYTFSTCCCTKKCKDIQRKMYVRT